MLTKYHRGFSLVELMVSLGIFAMVSTMATGAYLIIINANRHAQAIATGINTVSYALENMTRNIRTGHGYTCNDLELGTFSFADTSGKQIQYTTLDGQIVMTKDGVQSALTDPSVGVDKLRFECSGGTTTDQLQSAVVITVSGHVTSGPSRDVPFNVQTMAVMRTPDL